MKRNQPKYCKQNRIVRKAEILACASFNCQVIKEFTYQEKHGYKCYEETLFIKFFQIAGNGSKTDSK